jgi:hypothetical protein
VHFHFIPYLPRGPSRPPRCPAAPQFRGPPRPRALRHQVAIAHFTASSCPCAMQQLLESPIIFPSEDAASIDASSSQLPSLQGQPAASTAAVRHRTDSRLTTPGPRAAAPLPLRCRSAAAAALLPLPLRCRSAAGPIPRLHLDTLLGILINRPVGPILHPRQPELAPSASAMAPSAPAMAPSTSATAAMSSVLSVSSAGEVADAAICGA